MAELRLPNLNAPTDREMLSQIRSYLYQLVPQLQWALNEANTTDSSTKVILQSKPSSTKYNVVEDGTVAGWHFRKWNTGYAECWYERSAEVNIETPWGTALYSGMVNEVEYPITFTEPPSCQVTCESDVPVLLSTYGTSTTEKSPSVMLYRPEARRVTATIHYYVHGRWK